ncbi:MAG: PAS domain S-box protein [Candidatus Omnitrophota bacterium]
MRIRTKFIIQTCGVVLIGSILFFTYARLEFKRNTVLFQSQRSDIEKTFSRILELKAKPLETLALDYTYWDEMVDYVKNPNKIWASLNLKPAIFTYSVDLLAVYNRDFLPVSHFTSEDNEVLYEQFSLNVILNKVFEKKKVNHFFVYTPKGLLEVFGASIHSTDDPERKNPPQGYFFTAKLWNREYVDEISKIIDCNLVIIYPYNKTTYVNKAEYREEAIQFLKILMDWEGNPDARIDATRISSSIVELKSMSTQGPVLIMLFVLFIAVIYIIFILRWVQKPLVLISKALKENNLQYIFKMQKGNNEFAEISRLMFRFSKNEVQLAKEIKLLKETEEKLEKERDRVQEYLDIADVMIMILDIEGNISMLNKKGCLILGYEEQEIMGKNWFESFLPEETKGQMREVNKKLISGNETVKYYENLILRKDGTRRIMGFHISPLRNQASQIIGVLISGEDITERKEAEKEVKRISDELHTIVDSSRVMIFYKDKTGRFIFTNKAFMEVVGLPKEKIEGKTANELFPEYAEEYWNDDLEVIKTNLPKLNIFEPVMTKRGLMWLLTDKIPYRDESGNVIGVIGFSLDITQQKKAEEMLLGSEEKYRSIVDNIGIGIAMLNPNMEILSINNQMKKWCPAVDLKQRHLCYATFNDPPREGVCSYCPVVKTFKDGKVHEAITETPMHGAISNYRIVSSPVKDKNGKIVAVIEMVEDITKSKIIEEELKRKTNLLEAEKEASVDGVLVVDENKQRVLINKRLLDLWKIPQYIAEDKNDQALLQYVVTKIKDPQNFLDKVEYLYNHKDEKSRDEVEFNDGRTFDRYSAPVINKDGAYFGRIWTFRDITELKQAEQKLKKDLHELEVFYKASIGREERILELKRRIKELEQKSNNIG